MFRRFYWIALLALAACAPAPTTPIQPATPPQGVTVVGAPRTVALRPFGVITGNTPSRVAGLATITNYSNGETTIEVTLANLPPNGTFAGNIRVGSCTNLGGVAVVLSSILSDARGAGSFTTRVLTSQIPTGRASINFYQRGLSDARGIGNSISCGEL